MLTKDEVKQALPANLKGTATQAFTDKINNLASDPDEADRIRENFVSFASVLQEGRYKTEDYLHAVAYVTYKILNHSNQDAYAKALPHRYKRLVARGASQKDIAAYVSAYNRGKLVNAIMEQTLVPVWILNQHHFQEAINVQVDLMHNSQSDKVKCEAANSILTHLAKPKEAANNNIQINVGETSGMNELKDMLVTLAEKQREAIESGVSTKDVAGQHLIEGKAKRHDED